MQGHFVLEGLRCRGNLMQPSQHSSSVKCLVHLEGWKGWLGEKGAGEEEVLKVGFVPGLCAKVMPVSVAARLARSWSAGLIWHVGQRVRPDDVHNVVELQHGVRWRVDEYIGQSVLVIVHLVVSHSRQPQVLHAVLYQL